MPAFDRILHATLTLEGALSDHPADRGGLTKFGITQPILDRARERDPSLPASVADLESPQAEALYKRYFWEMPGFDHLPGNRLPGKMFDLGVHTGVRQAIRLLQRALQCFASVEADGILGPLTLDAVRLAREDLLICALQGEQYAFYRRILQEDKDQKAFIRGWLKRVAYVGDPDRVPR